MSAILPAREVVRMLGLVPHPEGGHYRETFRDDRCDAEGRPASTAILFLLAGDEVSEWHRVDATEIWHYYAGAPLVLTLSPNGHDASAHRLGPAFDAEQTPQLVVPAGCWQTAASLGAWTLVGCTVAPGFRFENFELAPPGWRPVPERQQHSGYTAQSAVESAGNRDTSSDHDVLRSFRSEDVVISRL